MTRRDFMYAGGSALLGTMAGCRTKAAAERVDYNRMMWGMLIHVGRNFTRTVNDRLTTDMDTFRRVTEQMAADGLNMVLIDVLEALRYPSHPELGVKGALEPEQFVAEVERLRRLGLEPLPKLNFSTAHHLWLGPYARKVSTPEYYEVCADVIRDTAEVFGTPRYFHIGMDEENYKIITAMKHQLVVIRQGDLWWHDLNFLAGEVKRCGCRPWIWCDRYWYHHDEFVARASKGIVMSNYFYDRHTDIATMRKLMEERGDMIGYSGRVSYDNLEKDGFDQIPTCSNWLSPAYQKNHPGARNLENTEWTVCHCKRVIAPERLKGFLTAPWGPCTPDRLDYWKEASSLLGQARKKHFVNRATARTLTLAK